MRKGSKTNLAKKRLPKKKTTKRAEAKVRGQRITGNKASAHNRHIQWKSQSVDTVAFALEEQEAGRASNREICRGCPTSNVRTRRAWMSCSKKETRSKPTW